MLINCPRCGFSQPQDQYCARCGIDMQSYKPQTESSFLKFFKSPILHILILFIIATYFGRKLLQNHETQFTSPLSPSQTTAIRRNTSPTSQPSGNPESAESVSNKSQTVAEGPAANESGTNQLADLKNQEITVPIKENIAATSRESNNSAHSSAPKTATAAEPTADITAPIFHVTFVEIQNDTVNRWIADSSSLGLYQNVSDFSVGVLPDYKKRSDLSFQVLKIFDKKIALGQTETELSGRLTEDGSQTMGLTTSIDYKSHENGTVHGSLMITRNHRQGRESFPIDFDLQKGAAFYIVGVLKRNHFQNERNFLTTPPFQIYKSADFLTQKTEFVIVIEPEYK